MIKKGSRVKVLVGKDKKKEGEIIELDRSKAFPGTRNLFPLLTISVSYSTRAFARY